MVTLVVLMAAGLGYVAATGLSAREEPGALESRVARAVRRLAVPGAARARPNPLPPTPDHLEEGLAHFADHCATCHANDGSANTDVGRGLFPRPPDMRQPATQELSDGELFYVIEHGVRFTGMPAFGNQSQDGEESSWRLVHVIRRLPSLTPAELERMEGLNPRPPDAIRRELEEERFLAGEDAAERGKMETGHTGEHE